MGGGTPPSAFNAVWGSHRARDSLKSTDSTSTPAAPAQPAAAVTNPTQPTGKQWGGGGGDFNPGGGGAPFLPRDNGYVLGSYSRLGSIEVGSLTYAFTTPRQKQQHHAAHRQAVRWRRRLQPWSVIRRVEGMWRCPGDPTYLCLTRPHHQPCDTTGAGGAPFLERVNGTNNTQAAPAGGKGFELTQLP